MQVDLYRITYTLNSTIGLLSIDGVSKYCTLEPSQFSNMLMPAGTFHCKKTFSERLQYICPELFDVPGHTEERMHIGNSIKDTLGCILVGMTRSVDWIDMSRTAFMELMAMLPEEFDITIHDQPQAV